MTHTDAGTIDSAAFQDLLNSWNTHHQLRMNGSSVETLAASRIELDAARSRVRSI